MELLRRNLRGGGLYEMELLLFFAADPPALAATICLVAGPITLRRLAIGRSANIYISHVEQCTEVALLAELHLPGEQIEAGAECRGAAAAAADACCTRLH